MERQIDDSRPACAIRRARPGIAGEEKNGVTMWSRRWTVWTGSRCVRWPIRCATWQSAVVVLASAEDGAVAIVSAVTKDLTQKFHAGKLVGGVAQAVGGKGGGRPDMAEGGGKDPSALPQALGDVYRRGRKQAVTSSRSTPW